MFASQRVLSDSCFLYFLFFPKVLGRILVLNSDCSRNNSCYWVFLLLLVCLLPFLFFFFLIGNAVFWCPFSEKTDFLAFLLFIPWDYGCSRNFLQHLVIQSPPMGVTVVVIVLPDLGKWIFLFLGEGIEITCSTFLSISPPPPGFTLRTSFHLFLCRDHK